MSRFLGIAGAALGLLGAAAFADLGHPQNVPAIAVPDDARPTVIQRLLDDLLAMAAYRTGLCGPGLTSR